MVDLSTETISKLFFKQIKDLTIKNFVGGDINGIL